MNEEQQKDWDAFVKSMPKIVEVGAWLLFAPGKSKSGKTSVWQVIPKENVNSVLGEIRWYGQWRKYAFFPAEKTLYEWHCLRSIADFCQRKTKEFNESKKKPKTATV